MMFEVKDFFDKLYFSECVLGDVHFCAGTLRISVTGLFLLAGHPLEIEGSGPYTGEFLFDGVVDSRRTITEYIGDARNPIGFKPSRYLIDEINVVEAFETSALQEFGFEGYQESPSAWIDNWVVRARSFKLIVNDLKHET